MNYNVDYFIKKFKAIPESEIGKGSIKNKCAYYYCDYNYEYDGEVAKAFTNLFADYNPNTIKALYVTDIVDGHNKNYPQPTPKQRILAALYDIKASENAVKQTQEILNTQTQLQTI